MQLSITGKNLEITDSLHEYVEKKISRLDRYLPNIIDARVELSVENTRAAKDRQIAQVTLRTKQTILRAEEASADMFASIDAVLEKMQRQVNRYKGKRGTRRGGGEQAEFEEIPVTEEETPEDQPQISRVKRFAMIPMDEEEAIEQMELLGHDFYVFFNANESEINVIYRRRSGDYGLIQPELS
ncbi:MAG: ribosomal subunit interface protein [Chloroflexi bacterium HGW-Chloroflexi-1]|nr:MAG: ribosomal subunit interface protein [Chloroflexi bacterium HGW-Chloroflexi-1]